MISQGVLSKMRAALLVCTCAAGCARGKHAGDSVDANTIDSTKDGQSVVAANLDASASGANSGTSDASVALVDDDDDVPHDASIDAPYGVIACPIHGAHPKLPDGGVDLTGLLTPATTPNLGSSGGLTTIGHGVHEHVCGGCGMGGPRPGGNYPGELSTGPLGAVSMGAITATPPVDQAIAIRGFAVVRAKARLCFNKGLLLDPGSQGRIVATVTFDASGKTANVTTAVSGDISPEIVACVTASIRRIENADLAKATLTVPFAFIRQGG